jgi:ribose transport system substrate-binding protein
MPDGGEYVTFVGRTSAHNAVERIDGFAEGAGEKFSSADSMGDDVDEAKAKENVRNAIGNHPDVKMLVGIWSYNAAAIAAVVQELDAREKYKIVAFDADPLAITGLEDGSIDALVVQNPYRMGYDGVKLLKALVDDDQATIDAMLPRRSEAGGAVIDTGLKIVVPDGETPLEAGAFEGVDFFRLKDFRVWLKQNNLLSS